MRAIHRTVLQSLVYTSALAAVALGLPTGFVACADAIHLDPPGAIVANDGGTEAGAACVSNPGCAYPTPVCDTDTETCVECLVISDCAGKPGTVCSQGSCQCASLDGAALSYCAGETQSCVDTTSTPTDCGACGNTCFGACTAGKCASAWSQTSTGANVPEARSHHVAVWTGSKMFVWGGKNGGALATGGLYDPVTNTWTATSTTDAPPAAYDATAVWDDVDNVVVVWGGVGAGGAVLSSGGRYDPATNTWQPTSPLPSTFAPRTNHTAVWAKGLSGFPMTTAGMIVWGGSINANPVAPSDMLGDGAIYDPSHDTWFMIPTAQPNEPAPRAFHVATWDTGSRMIIFGGNQGASTPDDAGATAPTIDNTTYIFTPSPSNGGSWNSFMPTVPSARQQATGAWDPVTTSTVVWGGVDAMGNDLNDGASLSGTAWTSFVLGATAPEPRVDHSAVVLSATAATSQLVVFGGDNQIGTPSVTTVLGTGWSYDLQNNAWTELPSPGPIARHNHTAVSTGSTMIVWGGQTAAGDFTNSGGIYNAAGP